MVTNVLTPEKIRRVLALLTELANKGSHGFEEADPDLLDSVISDYYRILEIAHHVRRGGVKAMIYRLETGRVEFVPVDYFDEASSWLEPYYKGRVQPPEVSNAHLLERLKAVKPAEEDAVSDTLSDIDAFILVKARDSAVKEIVDD
jgi:hypothetical protein